MNILVGPGSEVIWGVIGFLVLCLVVGIILIIANEEDVKQRRKLASKFKAKKQFSTRLDADELYTKVHEYLIEKTWGTEGLRWQIISADKEKRKIFAEIKWQFESNSGSTSITTLPLGDESAVSFVNKTAPAIKARFISLKLEAIPVQSSSFSALKIAWECRYTEQSANEPPPWDILNISNEFWQQLDSFSTKKAQSSARPAKIVT